MKRLMAVTFICLAFSSCLDLPEEQLKFEFYQGYAGRNEVYMVEQDFLNEFTCIVIYSFSKEEIFRKRLTTIPCIDSVIGNKIYLSTVGFKGEWNQLNPRKIVDTIPLGYKNFYLITRNYNISKTGNEAPKKWDFVRLQGTEAVFLDLQTNKNISVNMNQITSTSNSLVLIERLSNAALFREIVSPNGDNKKRYFDAFFR